MFRKTLSLIVAASIFPMVAGATDLVLPPGASIPGRTVSQLATEWWQWAMSLPNEVNPVRDRVGTNCNVGQQGSVWFLAGGFGTSKIHRVCTIPYGKAIFLPVINMAYWPQRGSDSYTCGQAKASAALNNDAALDLFAELDGTAVQDVKQYRVSSKECFDMFERIPSSQRPYNAYPSASDGYWLLLRPLVRGRHVLKFGGRYNRSSPDYGRMVQDIEYELIVQ